MNDDDRAIYNMKRLAGNAEPFRMSEQFDDDDGVTTLADFVMNYYKKGEVDVDDQMGVIRVSVPAEGRGLVDVGDMRKSQDYMANVVNQYRNRGGQTVPGNVQFVGISANDQFSVNLVFQITDNPTKF